MPVSLDTLASYVPRLVIRRLAANPYPLTEPREEYVSGALLFADIAGFGRLADQLAQNHWAGAEELTDLLNQYFGLLIRHVHEEGGDVVKFAGDAMLAFWPVNQVWDTLEAATLAAARCGLIVQSALSKYQKSTIELKLRIFLVAGEFRILELGGVAGRWEMLLTGPPLDDFKYAGQISEVGKVVASPTAWSLLKPVCQGQVHGNGSAVIVQVPPPEKPAGFLAPPLTSQMEAGLRGSLPAGIAARLAAGQQEWMAELRQISVVFMNLPWLNSSIPLSMAQSVVDTIERTVIDRQGSLNKLSMDEKGVTAVVVFGLPPWTHEDDPQRAVLAARGLLAVLNEAGHATQIGITTGTCFCGLVGSDERREYTVIGDTVNLAARLMQQAKNRILCDAATAELAQDRFRFSEHEPIAVKGKEDPVAVFEPLEQRQSSRLSQSATIGQEEHQAEIQRLLDDHSQTGQARVILIEGEAGIGKSRLTQFLAQSGQSRGYLVLSGNGDSIEETSPYHVWRSVISQLLEHIDDPEESPKTPSERLLAWLEADPKLSGLAPLLKSIVPLEIPENATTRDMVGKVRAENLQLLVAGLLRKLSAQSRVLIVLDDGQWFDSASWGITRQVAREVPSLLLALALRPFDDAAPADYVALEDLETSVTLFLTPLSAEETRDLICERLGVCDIPLGVVNWIFDRAEGNPLFSEELTFVLRDAEMLDIGNGTAKLACSPTELAGMNFPNALKGVVSSRFDRLAPSELLAIKTASVIGRNFEYRVLYHTYPIRTDRDQLPRHMDSVCQRDLVVRARQQPELIYAFKHVIIQDVAYNLMLFQQRRALHQVIAEWYESAEGGMNATVSLLAHHWNQAGVEDKAKTYQEEAGDDALKNGAHKEAAEFYQALVKKWKPASPKELTAEERLHRASLEHRWASALLGLGQLAESRFHNVQALIWLGEATPRTSAALVNRLTLQSLRQVWHRFRSGKVARPNPEPRLLEAAKILEQLAEIHYLANDTFSFLYACLRMLNVAEQAGPSPELARAFANMGLTAATIPWPKLAESYMKQARETVDRVDHRPSSAWVYFTTGIYHVGLGNWILARENLQEALDLYQQLGDNRNFGSASTVLGGSYYFAGNFREGLTIWTEHHERSKRRDDVLHQAWGHGGCALNLLRLGDFSQAISHAESALALFEVNRDRISEIMVHGVLAVARLRENDLAKATFAADATLKKIRALDRPNSYLMLEGYSGVIEVYFAKHQVESDPVKKKAHLATARSALKVMKTYARVFPIGKPRYELWLGQAAIASGSPEKAARHWHTAFEWAERLEMVYEQALAHWMLAQHSLKANEQQTHAQRALELFTQTEAQHDRRAVEEFLAQKS
jgi:class 3 adenylate cyclase/tetratricopeptide (TPR) repeat protein